MITDLTLVNNQIIFIKYKSLKKFRFYFMLITIIWIISSILYVNLKLNLEDFFKGFKQLKIKVCLYLSILLIS